MPSNPGPEEFPLLSQDTLHDDPLDGPADSEDADTDAAAAPAYPPPPSSKWLSRNEWVGLALASGACAAFNGVFAKLTTTELTSRLSEAVAGFVGLDSAKQYVEVAVRGTFFALNLVFNGVMWTLFTRALARGHSATQVSIMNTSANFVLTALLGFAVFSEALPPLWWLGAAMLVAGNVIVGRKNEDEGTPGDAAEAAAEAADPEATPIIAASAAAAARGTEPESSTGRRTS